MYNDSPTEEISCILEICILLFLLCKCECSNAWIFDQRDFLHL